MAAAPSNVPAQGAYQNATTDKKHSEEMTVPFFRAIKDNKILYILGTYHNLQYDLLPHVIKEIISKQIINLICESNKTNRTLNRLYESNILVKETNEEWFKNLSEKAIYILKNNIAKFCFHWKFPVIGLEIVNPKLTFMLCEYAQQIDGVDQFLENRFANYFSLDEPRYFNANTWNLFEISTTDLNQKLIADYDLENIKLSKEEQDYLAGRIFTDSNIIWQSENEINAVVNRNIHWLPKIVDFHHNLEGTSLLAVGTLHLMGRKGVLMLLNRCGFTVSQINTQGEFVPWQLITSNGPSFSDCLDNTIASDFTSRLEQITGTWSIEPNQKSEKISPFNLVTEYVGDLIANIPNIFNHYNMRQEIDKDNISTVFIERVGDQCSPLNT